MRTLKIRLLETNRGCRLLTASHPYEPSPSSRLSECLFYLAVDVPRNDPGEISRRSSTRNISPIGPKLSSYLIGVSNDNFVVFRRRIGDITVSFTILRIWYIGILENNEKLVPCTAISSSFQLLGQVGYFCVSQWASVLLVVCSAKERIKATHSRLTTWPTTGHNDI
jgi:hypothetical protein